MKFAILIIGGILLFQTLPVSAGTFFETFDRRDLKDWEEVNERNFGDGEWRIVDGVLHAESKDNAIRMLVIKDAAWHDYEIEIDVMPLDRHGRGHIVLAARVNETHAIVFAIGNIFWNAPAPIVSGFIFKLNTGRRVGIPLILVNYPSLKTWACLKPKSRASFLFLASQRVVTHRSPRSPAAGLKYIRVLFSGTCSYAISFPITLKVSSLPASICFFSVSCCSFTQVAHGDSETAA